MRKIIFAIIGVLLATLTLTGCGQNDADVASHNLSTAADNFEIYRQVVFYNGITGAYIAEVDGYCSIGNNDSPGKVSITCKLKNGKFVKNYLGLSDNVTWFALQSDGADVSTSHYRVVFKPSTVVPNVDFR
jgi:hypothetical protein